MPFFEQRHPDVWSAPQDEQTRAEVRLTRICCQHPEVAQVLAEVCNGPVALRPLSILVPDLDLRQILGALTMLEDAGVVRHVKMRTVPPPRGLIYLLSAIGERYRGQLRRLASAYGPPSPAQGTRFRVSS